jgi:hypothetical protein
MSPRQASPFAESDFSSADGFLTTVWGPGLWMILHTVSLNYPVRPTRVQQRQYKAFFDSLRHVLPCGKCRDNLVHNLKATKYGKPVFASRDALSRWVHQLHTNVNTMLQKPTTTSFEEMRNTYEHFRARCGTSQACGEAAASNAAQKMIGGGTLSTTRRRSRGSKGGTHGGCTEPTRGGVKSRCVLNIVPVNSTGRSLCIDRRCLRRSFKQKK